MPFDMSNQDSPDYGNRGIPAHLDYPIEFESSRLPDHKFIINGATGDVLGHAGTGYNPPAIGDFFVSVKEHIKKPLNRLSDTEQIGNSIRPEHLEGATCKFTSCYNNAWAMMDINFPNWKIIIETDKHQTEVTCRMCALTSVNASRSKTVIMGGKDTFCTNGLITENARIVKQKNTRGSSMSTFVRELASVEAEFMNTADVLQQWARTPIVHVDVKAMLDKIIGSEQMSKKMYSLYSEESAVRGTNVFALYSAFTNYASYQDERNGFKLRNTGKDTIAKNMWDRESKDVMKWINTPTFKELVA
tara:strand:- start:120 stop:1028 length:909 start_codon:yes stop_codon:yes gene_type:complete